MVVAINEGGRMLPARPDALVRAGDRVMVLAAGGLAGDASPPAAHSDVSE
jgi:Trk K+ transport system NAD-binding subunit